MGGNSSGEIRNKSGQSQRRISSGTGYSDFGKPFWPLILQVPYSFKRKNKVIKAFFLGANHLEL